MTPWNPSGARVPHRGERILSAAPARNLSESRTRYLIDPADHIRARREARALGLDVVGFYHSHPEGPAFPSLSDVAEATYGDVVWLIAGRAEAGDELRLFEIANEQVKELRYEIEG